MRKFISLIILMLSLTAGCCSAVTCEVLLAQINTVGFGTVNVQRDIPVGATIASTVSRAMRKLPLLRIMESLAPEIIPWCICRVLNRQSAAFIKPTLKG